eukprot:gene6565-7611_t
MYVHIWDVQDARNQVSVTLHLRTVVNHNRNMLPHLRSNDGANHEEDCHHIKTPVGSYRFQELSMAILHVFCSGWCPIHLYFALGTPLFKQKFKLTPSTITLIQSTAGPISGFIIQPIIGVYSDNCKSRWGRRRPFITAGAFFCVVSLLAIAFSPDIGLLCGDNKNGTTPHDFKIGILIAIIGFCVMNLAVNVMQGPTRSLVADLAGDKQQLGNAMAANTMGLASIVANIIGATLSQLDDCYRIIFVIGAAFTAVSIIPTLIVSKEKVMTIEDVDDIKNPLVAFKKIGTGFRTMPLDLMRISLVFFVSWFAFSPYMVSVTNYFGSNVFPGNYQKGVSWGFWASAFFSLSSYIFSFLLHPLIKIFGYKFVYSMTQVVAGVGMILFLVFDKPSLAVALIITTMIGPNFTCFNSIPYALMAETVPKRDAGMYMGVLNSAAVVSQTISILISGRIEASKNEDSAYAIAFGGCIAIAGGLIAWLLPMKRDAEEVEINADEDKPLLI